MTKKYVLTALILGAFAATLTPRVYAWGLGLSAGNPQGHSDAKDVAKDAKDAECAKTWNYWKPFCAGYRRQIENEKAEERKKQACIKSNFKRNDCQKYKDEPQAAAPATQADPTPEACLQGPTFDPIKCAQSPNKKDDLKPYASAPIQSGKNGEAAESANGGPNEKKPAAPPKSNDSAKPDSAVDATQCPLRQIFDGSKCVDKPAVAGPVNATPAPDPVAGAQEPGTTQSGDRADVPQPDKNNLSSANAEEESSPWYSIFKKPTFYVGVGAAGAAIGLSAAFGAPAGLALALGAGLGGVFALSWLFAKLFAKEDNFLYALWPTLLAGGLALFGFLAPGGGLIAAIAGGIAGFALGNMPALETGIEKNATEDAIEAQAKENSVAE
ncbi:MAG: hypothetical protein AAB091_01085 [Elusimicrobiota bacterium]